jgi:RHS repeat-associated protein
MAQIGCDTISGQQIGESSSCVSEGTDVYFGGKLIAETDASGQVLAPTDRLGTVRGVNTNGTMAQPTYFPYGEPKTAGGIDRQQQFGTYVRDSTPSAQDYAGQRYYSNVTGRFFSPDPGGIATANPRNPGSWNRYAYVHGDPVNFMDTTGGIDALICGYEDDFGDDGCFDPGDDGGGGLPYCSDDGLGFAPNPFCYAPGPMPPATPTPPPPVDCFAQLKDRPVDDPGAAKVGAVHTFWWVQGDMDGQTVQYIISAGPTPPNQSGVRYLNVSVTPGSDNGKDNSGANTAWSSGLSTANCDGVDAMIMAALGLEISNNTIVYHYFAFLGFGGPNSNSVAHYPWSRQRSALTPQHPAEPGPGRCSEARNDAKVAVGRAGWSDAGSAGGQILGLVLDLRAGPTGR